MDSLAPPFPRRSFSYLELQMKPSPEERSLPSWPASLRKTPFSGGARQIMQLLKGVPHEQDLVITVTLGKATISGTPPGFLDGTAYNSGQIPRGKAPNTQARAYLGVPNPFRQTIKADATPDAPSRGIMKKPVHSPVPADLLVGQTKLPYWTKAAV